MAEHIGEITILHGNAFADGPEGARQLTLGSPIYNDDVVSTGTKGALEIEFTDGAKLSQGPDSKVHLDEYVFDPDQDAGEMTMNLIEGTFRSVTGEIVDMNPEGFKIDTPNTTIGIRGTTTGHFVGTNGNEEHVVLDFVNKPVIIRALIGGPPRVISQDGMGVASSPTGLGLVRPAPPNILNNLEQLSSGALQRGAPTFQSGDDGNDGGDDGDTPDNQDPQDGDGQGDGGEGEGGEQGLDGGLLGGAGLGGDGGLGVGTGLLGPGIPFAGSNPFGLQGVQGGPLPQHQPIPLPTGEDQQTIEEAQEIVAEITGKTLDLSTETDPMTVNLLGASPAYYEVTDAPDTRVDIADTISNVVGSQTASNTIIGDEQDNILTGGLVNDIIDGGAGNDTIFATGGSDNLDGGAGTDMVSYIGLGSGVDIDLSYTASYPAGNPTFTDTLANFENVSGSNYSDTIFGTSGDNAIYGNGGDDLLWGGGGGTDSLFGGDGSDRIKVHGDMNGTIDGGDGTDVFFVYGGSTYDLTGLTSVTNMEGVYFNAAGGTVTVEADDFADFAGGASPAFSVDSKTTTAGETLEIKATSATGETATIDLSSLTFGDNWTMGTGSDIIKLTGDLGNDSLMGSTKNDHISGGEGNDSLAGNTGIDTLNGDAGDDQFDMTTDFTSDDSVDGGTGNDTLTIDSYSGALTNVSNMETIVFQTGMDVTSVSDTLIESGKTLTVDASAVSGSSSFDGSGESDGINFVTGAQNDVLWGGSGNDTFTMTTGMDHVQGQDGDDRFDMGSDLRADDVVYGGSGNDSLYVTDTNNNSDDFSQVKDMEFIELGASDAWEIATDTLVTSGKTLTMDATATTSLIFDASAETDGHYNILGSDGGNTLTGGAGNDTLQGGSGTDVLDGGAGSNILSYASSTSGVSINLADQTASGGDTAGDTITWSSFSGIIGGKCTDTLTGDANANQITGGDWADVLVGGAGNDTFYYDTGDVDSGETVDGGSGIDRIYVSTSTDFSGSAGETSIEELQIAAGQTATFDIGMAGFLGGLTTLYSADTAHTSTETVLYQGTSGIDNLDFSAESLTYDTSWGSEDAFTIEGGAGNDVIKAWNSATSINGGAGADDMTGGTADDIFIFNTGDVASGETMDGGDGFDTLYIETSTSFEATNTISNIENIRIAAGQALTLTTSMSLLNDLPGDEGIISGASGATVEKIIITGTSGADTYELDSSTPFFSSWGSEDTITIEGNDGDDVLTSNWTQAATIDGGTGNDYLTSGEATDTLTGGVGEDTFYYRATSHGGDTITDFSATDDTFQFDGSNFDISDATESVGWDFVTGAVDETGNNGSSSLATFIFDNTDVDGHYDLYFDVDGNGSSTAVLIAHIDNADMTAADIEIINL